METLEQRIQRVIREEIALAPYDPEWPESFQRERDHLLSCFPGPLIRRIDHIGSTAVPGLAAKPIVDVLVEVVDLEMARAQIVPELEAQGCDYFWRPLRGDHGPPFYAWFIRRDAAGVRTHHIHMGDGTVLELWDSLLFRDYLIEYDASAREYEALKRGLASEFPNDRARYTQGKAEFVTEITERARLHYGARRAGAHGE
jgi:GrpB-like predicted nucleotidyltransferase (UPF0157 family)